MMPRNVITASIVYGSAAWVVTIGVVVLFLRYSHVVIPGVVGLALIAGGVTLERDVLTSDHRPPFKVAASVVCVSLGVVALRIWGVV